VGLLASGSPLLGQSATAPAAPNEDSKPVPSADTASYEIGLLLGSQLRNNGVESTLSVDALQRGLKESLQGKTPTSEERDEAMRFMRAAHQTLLEKNQHAAKDFLAKNAKQPGVVSLPSGLQYRVLTAGDTAAKSPGPTDQVTVRYRASLSDGKEFDRSESHDRPASFRVNTTFKAWQEAFQAMKPGAKWQLFVPPELGYGSNTPPGVAPGSLLIYELELLKVEPAPPVDPSLMRRPPPPAPPAGRP
jgi:FKBP-type peptidyl-prolyl cis-trans isomerase FklB